LSRLRRPATLDSARRARQAARDVVAAPACRCREREGGANRHAHDDEDDEDEELVRLHYRFPRTPRELLDAMTARYATELARLNVAQLAAPRGAREGRPGAPEAMRVIGVQQR
jgi:hypothetical protein